MELHLKLLITWAIGYSCIIAYGFLEIYKLKIDIRWIVLFIWMLIGCAGLVSYIWLNKY